MAWGWRRTWTDFAKSETDSENDVDGVVGLHLVNDGLLMSCLLVCWFRSDKNPMTWSGTVRQEFGYGLCVDDE